jgi:hypothetical protein
MLPGVPVICRILLRGMLNPVRVHFRGRHKNTELMVYQSLTEKIPSRYNCDKFMKNPKYTVYRTDRPAVEITEFT